MSELRRDPITGRLVVVAFERLRGATEARLFRPQPARVVALDGDMCPFCEGQEGVAGREILAWRPHGSPANSTGWQLRVVPNRTPILRVEANLVTPGSPLFQTFGGLGAHEVIIETPQHDATLASMSVEDVWRVLWAWRERIRDLKRDRRLKSFAIVKNVGSQVGARLDHPHSQLIALPLVPQHLGDEMAGAARYHEQTRRCVFCQVVEREIAEPQRIITADAQAVSFAPFASRVPFETCIIPRGHQAAFDLSPDDELRAIARHLRDLMQRLDATLISPPYTLLLHTATVGQESSESYHWHLEIIPRLAPVSGLEWGGGLHVNTLSPEYAAEALRESLQLEQSLREKGLLRK